MNVINYEQILQKYQSFFAFDPKFSFLLNQMEQVIKAYQQYCLPEVILSSLEVSPEDFTRLLLDRNFWPNKNIQSKRDFLIKFAQFLDDFRSFIQERFGIWAMINAEMMDLWVDLFPQFSYLELMAGNGILSAALKKRRQKVWPTDSLSWSQSSNTGNKCWTDIEQLDAISAIKKYGHQVDVILLAWSPDHDLIDTQILHMIHQINPQPQFWIIGEYKGATNSLEFWQQAHLCYDQRISQINQRYPHFDIVQDHLFKIG